MKSQNYTLSEVMFSLLTVNKMSPLAVKGAILSVLNSAGALNETIAVKLGRLKNRAKSGTAKVSETENVKTNYELPISIVSQFVEFDQALARVENMFDFELAAIPPHFLTWLNSDGFKAAKTP